MSDALSSGNGRHEPDRSMSVDDDRQEVEAVARAVPEGSWVRIVGADEPGK